ncbi:MAG: hypothetical protein R3258_07645 [Acidimicrobiia bacterium]|nr:hypothetical protein [Acidimicrobiia bacterium]
MNDGDVGVIVAIEDDRIRLSVGASEIGEWDVDECDIQRLDEGVFSISAEDEALRFLPNQPQLFQQAVGARLPRPQPATPASRRMLKSETLEESLRGKLITVVAAVIAGALGIWALLSLL